MVLDCASAVCTDCDGKEWKQAAEEQPGRELVLFPGTVMSCWDDLGRPLLWGKCGERAEPSSRDTQLSGGERIAFCEICSGFSHL